MTPHAYNRPWNLLLISHDTKVSPPTSHSISPSGGRFSFIIRSESEPSSLSEEFAIETVVKQGCGIAPYRFNCLVDHLMRPLLSRYSVGIQLGEYLLTGIDYADDIAIFAPSACLLQEVLVILQEEAILVGVPWPKPKLMEIISNPTNHLQLKICNNEVLFVDSFTYIGSLITNDGSSSRYIASRIAKAASAMRRLSNPLLRKHGISIRTMYCALVVSVLLYGSGA